MTIENPAQLVEFAAALAAQVSGYKAIGMGIAAIAMGGAGVGLGHIFGNYLNGALRNPSAAAKFKGDLLLGFALTEAIALFAFVVVFLILFLIPTPDAAAIAQQLADTTAANAG